MPNTYTLTLHCPDKPGIVAAVSGFLADRSYNITEAAQFWDELSGHFFMRTVFVAGEWSAEDAAAFKDMAAGFGMDWHVHDMSDKPRMLIMVSKTDHCLNDILYRHRTGHLPIEITAIASNHEDARALVEARGLRFEYVPITKETKAQQEAQLRDLIAETNSENIVLARYMQVLSDRFCADYAGRIINIHHSFLPGFKGAKPYHQAWERGVKIIGATAHFVTADLDEGPIIEQDVVRIDHTMTPKELQVLGRDTESRVLSKALLMLAQRRVFLHGARTVIL